jgi:hypothetical protein
MQRDRIAELTLIRQRADKYRRVPSKSDLNQLKDVWERQLKDVAPTDELIPIRIVTFLEVFFRHWIEALIDKGAPYVERASKLKIDLKYDFAIASSLQGGSVSLGQLIAHSASLSRVESFSSIFGTLLDINYFDAISKTRDRWKVRHEPEVGPIIDDISRVLKNLKVCRHRSRLRRGYRPRCWSRLTAFSRSSRCSPCSASGLTACRRRDLNLGENSLAADTRERFKTALNAAYCSGEADGPRSFAASAWAVRGIVP